MIEKKLIYIGVPGSAVFESQVIGLLHEIKKKNYFNKIVLLAGVRHENEKNITFNNLKGANLEIVPFKLYPNYHFYKRSQIKELKKVFRLLLSDNSIIHIRGESLSQVVMPIVNVLGYNNVKILTDLRGASYEETLIYNKLKPILFQLKLYQHRKNLKLLKNNSHYISCVSDKLKQYFIEKSNISENKVFVNHCLAGDNFVYSEEIRKVYRNNLKLTKKDVLFLFVTGGDKKWQNTIKIISKIVDKGYKVLNLSKKNIDLNNVINLFVPYEEVPNYLNAADISIIWRNNDVVNNVASPVKFSEYICAGLPIVANNGVDLVKDYINKTGFGKLIGGFDDLGSTEIEQLISLNREEISNYAVQKFSSVIISEQYISIYNKLLN